MRGGPRTREGWTMHVFPVLTILVRSNEIHLVQHVNAQHEMLKTFLNRRLRSVRTYRLPHYLESSYLMRK